jgi:biopolymer transport protein TolR
MNIGKNDNNFLSEINVTPFVDVMLVLLVIFMITAPMMVQGIDVNLPKVSGNNINMDKNPLILTISKNGKIFINREEIKFFQLRYRIKNIYKYRLNKELILKADERVPYGLVVKVMGEVRKAGIEKLGVVTEPLEKE